MKLLFTLSPPLLPFAILLSVAFISLGCGNSPRTLQSVEVSPAAATSFAQFTATGIYNSMPTNVDITSTATWCVGQSDGVCQGPPPAAVQVNAGAARCQTGATGTYTILAGQTSEETPGMGPILKPFGAAQLTCP